VSNGDYNRSHAVPVYNKERERERRSKRCGVRRDKSERIQREEGGRRRWRNVCVLFPLIIGLHVKSGLGVSVYLSVRGSPCVWSGLSHISVRISRAVTPLLKSSGVSPFDSSLSNRAGDKPPFTMSLFCSCGILH